MWSFDNIQVFIAVTRQGFIRTLYFLTYTGFSGMGNANCTGAAFGVSCLSVPSSPVCLAHVEPLQCPGCSPVFGDVFVGVFPNLDEHLRAPCLCCLPEGGDAFRAAGDLLICVCLHGVSEELLSVPLLPFLVPEAVEIYLCLI